MAAEEETQKRMVDRVILCYFDVNTRDMETNVQRIREEFRSNIHTFHEFNDWDVCIDFITDANETDIVCLYTKDEYLSDDLLSVLNSIYQLKSIYTVYYGIPSRYTNHRKVIPIQYDSVQQLAHIKQNLRQKANQMISFQTFRLSNDRMEDISKLNRLDASFMYSQLIKEMLIDTELDYDDDYIEMFIEACRTENSGNTTQLGNITQFKNTYKQHSALWWYTKESFLYSAVNRALRTQDVTMLFMMGFFIHDLHQGLVELQKINKEKQSFSTLYRGQGLAVHDLQRLQQHSARDDPLHIGVLFRIQLHPIIAEKHGSTSPFAPLKDVSYYPHEDEILFSMHTVFRIKNAVEIEENLWLFDLDLTNDQDEQLNVLLDQLSSEIYVTEVFNVDKVGKLSLLMGDYDGALDVYNTLLNMFPDNLVLSSYVHHHLGLVYQQMHRLDEAIHHYLKAIDIRRSFGNDENNDRYSMVTYANLTDIYKEKGDLDQARANCERALALFAQKKNNEESDPIMYCYHLSNLALVQHAENNVDDALKNYKKVIELRLKHLPSNHPDLCLAYSNLAVVCGSKKDYSLAVEYLQQALEVAERSLPDKHDTLAVTHYNIGVMNENWKKYDEALKHFQKAVEIARALPSFDSEKLASWIQAMDEVRENLTSFHE
ncbi:unnamed protein product [Adineta ricciae]|uniref:NAD(P)(+)--arginine ADP-ribosyltransferase n=1 Tax=Adineta ricciae TaxID=249248 RepID=A0A815FF85_ADIRI|nr:unnamed protein product [Adineta ricciae]